MNLIQFFMLEHSRQPDACHTAVVDGERWDPEKAITCYYCLLQQCTVLDCYCLLDAGLLVQGPPFNSPHSTSLHAVLVHRPVFHTSITYICKNVLQGVQVHWSTVQPLKLSFLYKSSSEPFDLNHLQLGLVTNHHSMLVHWSIGPVSTFSSIFTITGTEWIGSTNSPLSPGEPLHAGPLSPSFLSHLTDWELTRFRLMES